MIKKYLTSYTGLLPTVALLYMLAFFLGITPMEADQLGARPATASIVALVIAFLVFAILVISTMYELGEHAEKLAAVRFHQKVIDNQEAYLKQTKTNLENFKAQLPDMLKELPDQLMNQDNPVATLIKTLVGEVSKAERELRDDKDRLVGYQKNIEARKIGTWSWIVDFYGEV